MTTITPRPNLGTQQSPIDIDAPASFPAELGVEVGWDHLILERNEDTTFHTEIEDPEGHLLVDGEPYVPKGLHMHLPAEHHLSGTCYAGEIHIVHVHEDDLVHFKRGVVDWCRLAVLGVFLRAGRRNYAPLKAELGRPFEVSQAETLPKNPTAFRYDGSLTTPPYSENVTFILFETPVEATRRQLDYSTGDYPNARRLHGRNRRYQLYGDVVLGGGGRRHT